MRIAINSRPGVVFGLLFVVAVIALLPLRLALGWFGLGDVGVAARAVRGSVWAGAMDDTTILRMPLGDLNARLAPLPLALGKARIGLQGRGAASASHGTIVLSRHSVGVADATAQLAAGTIKTPVPITLLDLESLSVRFVDGRCAEASGRVHATIGGDVAGIDLGGGLSGDARCDGDSLLLPLVSAAGTQRVILRIAASGRYHVEVSVQLPDDPAALSRLTLAGFRPGPQGYSLSVEGTF